MNKLLFSPRRLTALAAVMLSVLLSMGCSKSAELDSESLPVNTVTENATQNSAKTIQTAVTPPSSHHAQLNSSRGEKFVGSERCASCHLQQFEQWQRSHHSHAMAEPNSDSVLGNFAAQELEYRGGKVLFETLNHERKEVGRANTKSAENTYFITTTSVSASSDEKDTVVKERYQVKYTLGVYPLQQYLLETGKGNFQVFEMAWDARAKSEGGQRWFNLLANESSVEENAFFWKHYFQNWNSQCASCHTTSLEKGFKVNVSIKDKGSESKFEPRFQSTWVESGVGCEACHGPGQEHLVWAQASERKKLDMMDKGLMRKVEGLAKWTFQDEQPIASKDSEASVATDQQCFSCHSLRHPINAQAYDQADSHWMNYFEPTAVQQPLYFADGQIREEVFVYGSFTQSKMHSAGVRCSDCHNVHSGEVEGFDAEQPARQENDGVCLQCHRADVFAVASHHYHDIQSEPARCVTCHMPERTYMQVDPRRDHSFKVPMPVLSRVLGVPNVCEDCHKDRDQDWAQHTVSAWRELHKPEETIADVGALDDVSAWLLAFAKQDVALSESTNSELEVVRQRLIKSEKTPEMQRVMLLLGMPIVDQASFSVLIESLSAVSPQLRLAAIDVMQSMDINSRAQYLTPLLKDNIKAVRLAATLALADLHKQSQYPESALLKQRIAQAISTYRQNQDLLTSQLKLADIYRLTDQVDKAEQAYLSALALVPNYIPALVNLADIYRLNNADEQAEPLLIQAIDLAKSPLQTPISNSDGKPDADNHDMNGAAMRQAAGAEYALGLLYARAKEYAKAEKSLAAAVADDNQNASYLYAYLLTLDAQGERARANKLLQKSPLAQRDPLLAKLLKAWNVE